MRYCGGCVTKYILFFFYLTINFRNLRRTFRSVLFTLPERKVLRLFRRSAVRRFRNSPGISPYRSASRCCHLRPPVRGESPAFRRNCRRSSTAYRTPSPSSESTESRLHRHRANTALWRTHRRASLRVRVCRTCKRRCIRLR